jgi:biotin carboxyl carrier protein
MATYYVQDGEDEQVYEVEQTGEHIYRINRDDSDPIEVDLTEPEEGLLHLLVDNASVEAGYRFDDGEVTVTIDEETHEFTILNERERRMAKASDSALGADQPELESPIAGRVVALPYEEGVTVEKGDVVVVVEAMKMENDLKAHRDGKVQDICVEPDQEVDIGDVLVTIE